MKNNHSLALTMRILAGIAFVASLPLVGWAPIFIYYLVAIFAGASPFILLVLLPGLVYLKVQAGMLNIISGRATPEGLLPRWALAVLFFGVGFGMTANSYGLKNMDYRMLMFHVPLAFSLLGLILSCLIQSNSTYEYQGKKR